MPSQYLWFGPNTNNFVRDKSEKINVFFKQDHREIALNVQNLSKQKQLKELSQINFLNKSNEILCNQRYDLLRKPKPIYFVVGKTLNVIFNKNTCHKIIDLFLYFDRYVFLEKNEFIAGERFGIKPKYILMKKQNYY